jgi:hypothetical protein
MAVAFAYFLVRRPRLIPPPHEFFVADTHLRLKSRRSAGTEAAGHSNKAFVLILVGAGVFLGAALLHVQPHGLETWVIGVGATSLSQRWS